MNVLFARSQHVLVPRIRSMLHPRSLSDCNIYLFQGIPVLKSHPEFGDIKAMYEVN